MLSLWILLALQVRRLEGEPKRGALPFLESVSHRQPFGSFKSLVGHSYYFLEYVYPRVAQIRGWRIKRVMEPPALLHYICGSYDEQMQIQLEDEQHLHQD